MDGFGVVTLVAAIVVTFLPIVLCVVVRRRQKRHQWSGGFTPGFRKWTHGEDHEWRSSLPQSQSGSLIVPPSRPSDTPWQTPTDQLARQRHRR